MGLEVEVALGPEAAAQQRDDDAHAGLGNLQRVCDAPPGLEGNLRGRPHRELVALPVRQHRARLDRHAVRAVDQVAAAHDHVGLRHRAVGIALDDRRVAERVAVAHERLVGAVCLPLLVHEVGALRHRRFEVGNRRQRLVLDLDQVDRLLGDLGSQRRDPGDDIALPAHLLAGEQPPVLHHASVLHIRHVLVGDDGQNPGQGPRRLGVDPQQAGMRVVRVPELRVQLAGQAEVGGVAADSGHLLLTVGPDEGPCRRARLLEYRQRSSWDWKRDGKA